MGRALVAHLSQEDKAVRVISRHRPSAVPDGVKWREVDVTDRSAATHAAMSAVGVYECLNAPYTDWPKAFSPLQRSVVAAAAHSEALLVTLENLYGYGPTGGIPMTELTPLAPTSVKGRTRVAMTRELLSASEAGRIRIAIRRASDFFGAGVRQSTLGERVFANAVAEGAGTPSATQIYDTHTATFPISLSAWPCLAAATGQVGKWASSRLRDIDHSNPIGPHRERSGPFGRGPVGAESRSENPRTSSPMMRGLAEMTCQFAQPFVLDTFRYESAFGSAGTPMDAAIKETVAWYRREAHPS